MKLEQFTNTNLVAVIERANEILAGLRMVLGANDHSRLNGWLTTHESNTGTGDEWELASIALAKVELMECRMRKEDDTVEAFPADWAGGLAQQFVTTQAPDPDDVCPKCEYSVGRCECVRPLVATLTPPPIVVTGSQAPVFTGNNLEKLSPQLLTNLIDWSISKKQADNESQARAYLRNLTALQFMQLYCEFATLHTGAWGDMSQIMQACGPARNH